MDRQAAFNRVASEATPWDVVILGGGATGLGTAVDAASRGYKTLLLEQGDFAKGTSSRSTKLSHGGVRYLQQGNIALVLEALKERGRMLRNAPHLVRRQPFIIPAYAAWQVPFYGIGLKVYDALSGSSSIGHSSMMGEKTFRELLPTIAPTVHNQSLAGGVLYYDGQFDDARYCIALALTLESLGGTALNYTRAIRLLKNNGLVSGVVARDEESGQEFEVQARVVINATGVFTDSIRTLDEPAAAPILTVSQGSHFVLPKSFLPGHHALMVPKTADGRVLFAIPWHGAVVIGTTDEAVPAALLEPRALEVETAFLNSHIELYFGRRPRPEEILSVWSGLRPLVRKQGTKGTAALSREHTVLVSPSHLVSVTGGKWTTYRRMAEDAVDIAAKASGLPERKSATHDLRLHGWTEAAATDTSPDNNASDNNTSGDNSSDNEFSVYGADRSAIDALAVFEPGLAARLDPRLPFTLAEVVWAARNEMARTVEDVLARRTRALFLDARAAIAAAPAVAACLAKELGHDEAWQQQQIAAFNQTAAGYIYQGN